MTTPTTTAQATVLTVEEQRACWAAILTHGENCHDSPLLPYPHTAPADAVTLLQGHIDALTEQVRVLRECVEWYAHPNNIDDANGHGIWLEFEGIDGDVVWEPDNGGVARSALAALEGDE